MAKTYLLRAREGHGHARVTYVELFFDLVFVFAVTQLSHSLLHHLSLGGALRTGLLFMAVWWVWIFTSWITNWLDPEKTPVRLMLLALMLAGLVLSTSLPEAFEDKGRPFALAYVAMQVGRTAFMLWAVTGQNAVNTRNFRRILCWMLMSGVFWIWGGFAPEDQRLGLWAIALAVEYASPSLGFWTPGLGRASPGDWDIEPGHLAERCGLFVIIALGESILVTGATFAEQPWTVDRIAAFATGFVGSVAMWWIYFDTGAERASRVFEAADQPGRLARLAYTYIHLLPVGGVVVSAVGDELVLAHPFGHVEPAMAATLVGGPALYVLGNLLFKRATAGRWPLSHLIGLAVLAGLGAAALWLPPLALAAAAAAALVLVAAWETRSLRGGTARTSPAPAD